MNFAKFPRIPFFTEHLRWLLLHDFDIVLDKYLDIVFEIIEDKP